MGRWWRGLGRVEQVAVIGIVVTLIVGLFGALPAYFGVFKGGSTSYSITTSSLPSSPSSGSGTSAPTPYSTVAAGSVSIFPPGVDGCIVSGHPVKIGGRAHISEGYELWVLIYPTEEAVHYVENEGQAIEIDEDGRWSILTTMGRRGIKEDYGEKYIISAIVISADESRILKGRETTHKKPEGIAAEAKTSATPQGMCR
jgi:hypothetical protein